MPDPDESVSDLPFEDRYLRQIAYEQIGAAGQRRLSRSRAVLIGCGAMGGVQADWLVRAGLGFLRLVDFDRPWVGNLHRQILFDESAVRRGLSKVAAAGEYLRRANGDVELECVEARADADNIEGLAEGVDLILDGTDNFAARYVINDVAVGRGLPWVYGGVVAGYGNVMTIVPGQTPCLRCLFPVMPEEGEIDEAETVGVLGPAVGVIGSLMAVEAMKILTDREDAVCRRLLTMDVWSGHIDVVPAGPAQRRGDCPCCGQGRSESLDGDHAIGG